MVNFVTTIRKIAQSYVLKLSNISRGKRNVGTKKNAKKRSKKKKRKSKKRTDSSSSETSNDDKIDLPQPIDLSHFDASFESESEFDEVADVESESDDMNDSSASGSRSDSDKDSFCDFSFEPEHADINDGYESGAGDNALV